MKSIILLLLTQLWNLAMPIRVKRASVADSLINSKPFRLSQGINQFTNDLYTQLAEDTDGNIVFSPFSLHTALSMVLVGSQTGSKTNQELAKGLYGSTAFSADYLFNYLKVLRLYDNLGRRAAVNIEIANRAFADDGLQIKANYTDYLQTFFQSTVQRVDFSDANDAANDINAFVKDATNGLIQQIADPSTFSDLTRMVLINAIYFKADWKEKFDKELTSPMTFKTRDDLQTSYPFGMNMAARLRTADLSRDGFDASILELPYENANFRMLLILPNGNIQDLDLNNLDQNNLDSKLRSTDVTLTLPKFKVEHDAKVKKALKKLGILDLFAPGLANLKDISKEDLHVSDVVHKAVVEVNEEGSEAAAVTLVSINSKSVIRKKVMNFNKPFFFIIQDIGHKVPLFFGRVTDPNGIHGLDQRRPALAERQGPLAEILGLSKPDCDENGFNTNSGNPGQFALPCKGHDTFPLRDRAREALREAQRFQ